MAFSCNAPLTCHRDPAVVVEQDFDRVVYSQSGECDPGRCVAVGPIVEPTYIYAEGDPFEELGVYLDPETATGLLICPAAAFYWVGWENPLTEAF